jgi:predicted methyltransferase
VIRTAAAGLFAAVLLASASAVFAQAVAPEIAAAVADAGRPAADKARDVNRKPAEIVAFAGVKPGMTILEINPGGGYYTRILAKAVGPNGRVIAFGPSNRPGAAERLAPLAAAYPNVTVMVADFTSFTVPQPVDLVWTTENYHDFHNGPTANIPGLNKSVYSALKPGGIFFVEDHSAAPGGGVEAAAKLHRMDEALAKTELQAAGFRIDGESNLLRNPADDRVSQNGEVQGRTDRFALRLRRP